MIQQRCVEQAAAVADASLPQRFHRAPQARSSSDTGGSRFALGSLALSQYFTDRLLECHFGSIRMRSGCSATSSFANRCIDCGSAGVAQRVSICKLRPSAQPNLRSSWINVASPSVVQCPNAPPVRGREAMVARLSRGVSGMSPPAGCMIRRDTSCNAGSARSDRTGVLELPTGGFYERRLRRRGRRCSLFAMRSGVEAVLYPVFQASHCCTTPARVEISPQMYRLWRSYGARFSQSPSEPSPESPIWRALFRGYRGQRVRSGIGGHPSAVANFSVVRLSSPLAPSAP